MTAQLSGKAFKTVINERVEGVLFPEIYHLTETEMSVTGMLLKFSCNFNLHKEEHGNELIHHDQGKATDLSVSLTTHHI